MGVGLALVLGLAIGLGLAISSMLLVCSLFFFLLFFVVQNLPLQLVSSFLPSSLILSKF